MPTPELNSEDSVVVDVQDQATISPSTLSIPRPTQHTQHDGMSAGTSLKSLMSPIAVTLLCSSIQNRKVVGRNISHHLKHLLKDLYCFGHKSRIKTCPSHVRLIVGEFVDSV